MRSPFFSSIWRLGISPAERVNANDNEASTAKVRNMVRLLHENGGTGERSASMLRRRCDVVNEDCVLYPSLPRGNALLAMLPRRFAGSSPLHRRRSVGIGDSH